MKLEYSEFKKTKLDERKIVLLICVVVFILGMPSSLSYAETNQKWKDACKDISHDPNENPTPYIMWIDLELIDIGKIDREAGTFEADFWLRFFIDEAASEGMSFNNLGKFEPDFNGRLYDANGKTIDYLDDSEIPGSSNISYYEQRKQGVFYSNMNFHSFPFETLELVLEIESPDPCTSDSLLFNQEQSYFSIQDVTIPGWSIVRSDFNIESQEYTGIGYEDQYAKFVGKIYVQGEPSGALVGIFFPILMITFLAISPTIFRNCKIMPPVLIPESIGLFSLVTFHISTLEKIPPVGYATLFDYVMMMSYFIIIGIPIVDRCIRKKTNTEKIVS